MLELIFSCLNLHSQSSPNNFDRRKLEYCWFIKCGKVYEEENKINLKFVESQFLAYRTLLALKVIKVTYDYSKGLNSMQYFLLILSITHMNTRWWKRRSSTKIVRVEEKSVFWNDFYDIVFKHIAPYYRRSLNLFQI